MLENNGFFGKTMGFYGKQCFYKAMFLTRLHTWFVLIIKHMHFIKIKTIHVLHKLFFQNTIPHRPCYSRTLILLCFALLHSEITSFNLSKIIAFFNAHILKLCIFSQKCAWNTQNANQKLSLAVFKERRWLNYHCSIN